jgi:hypothetical protein
MKRQRWIRVALSHSPSSASTLYEAFARVAVDHCIAAGGSIVVVKKKVEDDDAPCDRLCSVAIS